MSIYSMTMQFYVSVFGNNCAIRVANRLRVPLTVLGKCVAASWCVLNVEHIITASLGGILECHIQ